MGHWASGHGGGSALDGSPGLKHLPSWGKRAWGKRPSRQVKYAIASFYSHCPLPIAHCPLPIAHYPLPITQCPLPNAQYPLFQ
ncbi:hypothetical protein [Tolypothrix sp. VBCCA 56010]|uniref:hypothetical protein n=1 Tax=Tolypothrix sp. VBCCA 56010 TaxID=3137731 RepID=UPI003D7E393A